MLLEFLIIFLLAGCALASTPIRLSLNGVDYSIYNPATVQTKCTVFVFGVGTSMTRDNYSSLGSSFSGNKFVFVVMDPEVGNPTKTSTNKFIFAYNQLASNANNVQALFGCNGTGLWVVGGHSSGGMSAHNALTSKLIHADATFSADPYDFSKTTGVSKIPVLYWGFDTTTCFVSIDLAAKAFYTRANSTMRVFHRAATGPNDTCYYGIMPRFGHCSFSDSGCTMCSVSCSAQLPAFHASVASSATSFIEAVKTGIWTKSLLLPTIDATTTVTTFMNSELP